ncbi:SDR family NAD(P)-dependent oxidoreductase [uncultured Pseudoalteromonas sp.]|uniref:SDR family NAD(P)-dependent oxidoreductase n=1 Tax=uncultured Pseudoalteromonas sp. TaxID=114053 RepID=UPI00261F78E0|nr:SDR family NAD(P)-dependent oxidoreductase [uncultured Pseudoalteromonas sp.]
MNHLAVVHDKVAVITGAAVGIGFALANSLATEGMKVVLFDIDETALKRALEKNQL